MKPTATGYGTLLLLTLAACGDNGPQPLVGTLERERIEIAAEQGERILSIEVREGNAVAAGAVLAQLDSARLQSRIRRLNASRDAAAARLAELQRGPRTETIDEARAALARTRAELELAQYDYARIDELFAEAAVSRAELDAVRARREAARAAQQEAAARLQALVTGTTAEELDRARAELRAAEAAVAELEIELDRLTLRAPRAATVDALPREAGEWVMAGQTVAILLADRPAYARVYVPETLRGRLQVGSAARIRYDGLPEPLSGRVRFIAAEAAFTPFYALTQHDRGRLSFLTEITIDDGQSAGLPAGMPVQVVFPGLMAAAP